ncbi:hypothetical protein B7463_g2938, partial [Scytalidium lignicola]
MADSVDRVFVHALNTVKKIPKTGASRPPPADRLRLYGLYKQAMEGDVDGVMDRPEWAKGMDEVELKREREKWDAWDAQRGMNRTEAKRRYIEALIETMHKYASTTADARELVAELEFVWDQIKNNSASSSGSSHEHAGPSYASQPRRFAHPQSGSEGPMRVLSPMSENDEADMLSEKRLEYDNDGYGEENGDKNTRKWRSKVELALEKMTVEIAALREQIATGREYQERRRRTLGRWIGWFLWATIKHTLLDALVLGLVLLWLRKRKDRRLEDLVRQALKIVRENPIRSQTREKLDVGEVVIRPFQVIINDTSLENDLIGKGSSGTEECGTTIWAEMRGDLISNDKNSLEERGRLITLFELEVLRRDQCVVTIARASNLPAVLAMAERNGSRLASESDADLVKR